MWGNTRMVVLTAICAALYAAILIPFKVVPLIPGITEFRPANAIPVVCSFLFGPAAAWGAAFGNLLHLLGFHPFTVLGTVVLVNNLVVAVVLAPFLLAVLYPRVQRARLLYRDLLGPRLPPPRWRIALGTALVVVGTVAAFAAGELIAGGRWVAPWAAYATASRRLEVGLGLLPLLGLAVGGLALL
ncbi:MAG: QueT transporter family protein [Deltaproteobacteria bacterium]|nr:MAG: QueT transporter family protein [Deltaproteobacteria bacterium]